MGLLQWSKVIDEKRRLVESWREDIKSIFFIGGSGTEFLAFRDARIPKMRMEEGFMPPHL